MGFFACARPIRKRTPCGAFYLLVLIVITHGDGGVVCQVGFQNSVSHFALEGVVVAKGFAVAVSQNGTPAQATVKCQRATHIHEAVIVVVTAAANADLGFKFVGGAFADHVDGARRIASAGSQAGGATDDFDAVVDDGVGVRFHEAEGVEHSVNLEVTEGVTAR